MVSMRAAVCYQNDELVRVEEVTIDAPKRNEVLVRMAASGVCHTDLSVITGIMPAKLPCVLGHEGAGTVELLEVTLASLLTKWNGRASPGLALIPTPKWLFHFSRRWHDVRSRSSVLCILRRRHIWIKSSSSSSRRSSSCMLLATSRCSAIYSENWRSGVSEAPRRCTHPMRPAATG